MPALLVSMLGCGGGGAAIDPKAFVGTWEYAGGSVDNQCPWTGVEPTEELTGQREIFSKGTDAALVQARRKTNCMFKLSISGNSATAVAGQTCMDTIATSQGDFPATFTVTSETFVVTGDTAQFSFSETVAFDANGLSVTCMLVGSGGLMRVPM